MKTIMIAIAVTGVIIGGLILRAVNSFKHSQKERLPEPDRTHELTTDFLL